MATTSRFFNNTAQSTAPSFSIPALKGKAREPRFVNVGGEGDCGFRSVAARIIDMALTSNKAKQPLLARLLEEHSKYFTLPQNGRLMTHAERIKALTITPEMLAKLIRDLAFTLRQMAVDELCAHPEYYRGAFVSKNENTSPEEMRKPHTFIDESAIAALANALEIPIIVKVVKENKELPMRLQYGTKAEEATVEKVVLQLQNQHYVPQVIQADRFEQVVNHPAQPSMPAILPSHNDPDLDIIIKRIEESDRQLINNFETNLNRLTIMVAEGEISKNDLLSVYVKGMENSDYLTGRIKNVGLEHGNQLFFEEAINNARKSFHVISLTKDSHEEQVTKELVHAISRAISIGHLNENNVYAQLEKDEDLKTVMTF